ncbi:MAG: UDP-N-acetylmuramoyl-tripeptide--D-alanyl-D-alanine ligase [Acidobacteria bacterium]|nr:UDP-N-acetylmuramoyl-tripeptide--D-alanyl-D-alanine ligase [Acidobacteriota bacterium]
MTAEQVIRALGARLVGARLPAITGFSIDSRSLQPGDLFFAIKGGRFDGHDFLYAAFQKGAAAAVVSRVRPEISPSNSQLLVADTTRALQGLALEYRRQWGGKLIAVTGSSGKTTTKTFATSILHARFQVYSNPGNLNNRYGLPLSLLRMPETSEVAVLEMGMSSPGEITALCGIAEPNVGVITNVQPVHLEFFRSLEEIAKAKTELADFLEDRGTWIYNADDALLARRAEEFRGEKISFGTSQGAGVRAEKIQVINLHRTDFELSLGPSRARVTLPAAGRYFVYDFLAAAAAGSLLGLALEEIAAAAGSLSPAPMRGRIVHLKVSATVMDDSYNSNPAALREVAAAAAALAGYSRRIAVLGEMLELGSRSREYHFTAGVELAEMGFDWIIGVQGHAADICEGARYGGVPASQVRFFPDSDTAAGFASTLCRSGDLMLVKGSRGVHTEKVVQRLVSDYGCMEAA